MSTATDSNTTSQSYVPQPWQITEATLWQLTPPLVEDAYKPQGKQSSMACTTKNASAVCGAGKPGSANDTLLEVLRYSVLLGVGLNLAVGGVAVGACASIVSKHALKQGKHVVNQGVTQGVAHGVHHVVNQTAKNTAKHAFWQGVRNNFILGNLQDGLMILPIWGVAHLSGLGGEANSLVSRVVKHPTFWVTLLTEPIVGGLVGLSIAKHEAQQQDKQLGNRRQ